MRGSNGMVLVVEDDLDMREAMRDLLVEAGYEVVSAGEGKEAFHFLGRTLKLPDVIVLDLMMPVMNGWELLELIKADRLLADIPVVVITAHVDARLPEVDGFLRKPFDQQEFLALIEEHAS